MGRDVARKESQNISSACWGHHQPVSVCVDCGCHFFLKQAEVMGGKMTYQN